MPNKVLFVDDEELMLNALRRQIGREFEALFATSGADALRILEANPDIEVVVADMKMPRMDGVELLRIVEQKHPEMIRVMLTGNVDRTSAERAVSTAHVFNYLTKPCETATLLGAVRTCLDLRGVEQDLRKITQG